MPVCVLGMGPFGVPLRLYMPSVGAALAYSYVDESAAPGQLSADVMAHVLSRSLPGLAQRLDDRGFHPAVRLRLSKKGAPLGAPFSAFWACGRWLSDFGGSHRRRRGCLFGGTRDADAGFVQGDLDVFGQVPLHGRLGGDRADGRTTKLTLLSRPIHPRRWLRAVA